MLERRAKRGLIPLELGTQSLGEAVATLEQLGTIASRTSRPGAPGTPRSARSAEESPSFSLPTYTSGVDPVLWTPGPFGEGSRRCRGHDRRIRRSSGSTSSRWSRATRRRPGWRSRTPLRSPSCRRRRGRNHRLASAGIVPGSSGTLRPLRHGTGSLTLPAGRRRHPSWRSSSGAAPEAPAGGGNDTTERPRRRLGGASFRAQTTSPPTSVDRPPFPRTEQQPRDGVGRCRAPGAGGRRATRVGSGGASSRPPGSPSLPSCASPGR